MSDTETKTRKALPTRSFNDEGTGRTFTAGTAVDLPEGEFVNYVAAGLVTEVADAAPARASK